MEDDSNFGAFYVYTIGAEAVHAESLLSGDRQGIY
jgi:hypothetical protein